MSHQLQTDNHLNPYAGGRWRSGLAICFSVLLSGGIFTPAPQVLAQPVPGGADGFGVVYPSFITYVQRHGGARTLGASLSHDFQLLGKRVQIFQRGVIQQQQDGSVQLMDLLGDALPLIHADGATFPLPDADISAMNPALDAGDYTDQAVAAVDDGILDANAPDRFDGLAVNFATTFRTTLPCDDAPSTRPCDQDTVVRAALDVWGLPTSLPAADPGNPDLVYLRFQRGIMQFSQSTGRTQAVPVGQWFQRVLVGTHVPNDLVTDMAGSRFFAQYRLSQPFGVARPTDLPATSLTAAFNPGAALAAAGTGLPSAVNPQAADPLPTPVFAGALPTFGTLPDATPQAGTPAFGTPALTAFATPIVTAGSGTSEAFAPGVVPPAVALGPDPCLGDEQILFAPKKPYVGTDLLIAVTSARHHDVRTVRLSGPVKTGPVNERAGLNGWVWEWTISPSVEGWYEFTFFVDGARPCATSGVNTLPAFGGIAMTLTATPSATQFATITPTPTPTTGPPPNVTTIAPATGGCGTAIMIVGSNFGNPAAGQSVAAGGQVFFGGRTAPVGSWSNTNILIFPPAGTVAGSYNIAVGVGGGGSAVAAQTFNLTAPVNTTC